VKVAKYIEFNGKRLIRRVLKQFFNPVPVNRDDVHREEIKSILVIRQDSRLGNLVLLSPFLDAVKTSFPASKVDILISEGFEEVLAGNSNIDRVLVFEKNKLRFMPWLYLLFIRNLRMQQYDLAVDVSDGHNFSLNNVMLTALSGARYTLGYDRGDACSFLNLCVPPPKKNTYLPDALVGLVRSLDPHIGSFSLSYYVSDTDRRFADEWLKRHDIREMDSFFVIHPGGKGKKRWGADNFAALLDRIIAEIGVRIVVIGGAPDRQTIQGMLQTSQSEFEVLDNVTIGQMAAVIERCDMFISGDNGPMHVSAALKRPTIGIFISSNFHVYGPRGKNGRIVISMKQEETSDDVMVAISDLLRVSGEADDGVLTESS